MSHQPASLEFPHRAAWQHRFQTVPWQFLSLFSMPRCQVTGGDGCADAQDVTQQSLQDVHGFARPIVSAPSVEFMDREQGIRIVLVAIQGARPFQNCSLHLAAPTTPHSTSTTPLSTPTTNTPPPHEKEKIAQIRSKKLAKFGQIRLAKCGQTKGWPNQVWPNAVTTA